MLIGRAPGLGLTLAEDVCGWRHCAIRGEEGRDRLHDFKSPGGTFLNGRHVLESVLTNGDQISIGASRFVYCEADGAGAGVGMSAGLGPGAAVGAGAGLGTSPSGEALLKACTVQTLVRSMAMAADAQVARLLEAQAIALMCELLPCDAGFLLLGAAVESLRAQLRERVEWEEDAGALCAALELMDHDEVAVAPGGHWQLLPLYVRGSLGGVLGLRLREGAGGGGVERDCADDGAGAGECARWSRCRRRMRCWRSG
ncbi:MAG: FHA domain-containing protein [Bryobacterales bacterium]|nr:FHA domain-containing protein [Bryobacterales bacterium]